MNKQKFYMKECELCSGDVDRWGRKVDIKRKFVSHADNPNKIICCNCGYNTQLNKQEDTKHGKVK